MVQAPRIVRNFGFRYHESASVGLKLYSLKSCRNPGFKKAIFKSFKYDLNLKTLVGKI